MSILDKVKKQTKLDNKKMFGIIGGLRLSGKSTIAGTLPGKTLMLQASVLESGSQSAEMLAKKLGNSLQVLNFNSLGELIEIIAELKADTEFDNVYVDGLSAVTEMKLKDPMTAALIKKSVWDGYRELGDFVTDVLLQLKELTYASSVKKAKNVFMTCALTSKQDKAGNVIDVSLDVRGNVAVTSVTKLGECVATVYLRQTEEGQERVLLTKTFDYWPGRIDGILDEDNPGIIPADLSQLLKLKEGK
jgi:hypothetical protein